MNLPISVLMAVYDKDNPEFLNQALKSITLDQVNSVPAQIVIVLDGPINRSLNEIISKWKKISITEITIIPLKENRGLAAALNYGLPHCKYSLVARMDSDDISLPGRFEKQFKFMVENPNISVSSGQIDEFDYFMRKKISERNLPTEHTSIIRFSKLRSPISHPCAIFKKEDVINSGSYPNVYPEDYALWGIMLSKGYYFANIPEKILHMRLGESLAQRRGLRFLKGEIDIVRLFRSINYFNIIESILFVTSRIIIRSSPLILKRFFYNRFR